MEIIRVINLIQSKIEYAKTKLGKKVKLIDIKAWNCFAEGISNSMIKCIIGYNPYGKRQKMINKRLYSNKCLRCVEIECWEHIITCKVIDGLKIKFIKRLYLKLQKYYLYETI